MQILLDTHAFIWFIEGNNSLSSTARDSILKPENQLYLSIASLWEIAIKLNLDRLSFAEPFEQLIPHQMKLNSIHSLPISLLHLNQLIDLPFHHRDPFDRLLIAQAISEKLPIITRDKSFPDYEVELIW
jgi:PIN domain nuclease of toxin-antitoxin system